MVTEFEEEGLQSKSHGYTTARQREEKAEAGR